MAENSAISIGNAPSFSLSEGRLTQAQKAVLSEKDKAKIDKTAKDFEAVFLSQMLENMFADVDVDPTTEDPTGKEIYKSILLNEYGKIMSNAGGIGLADSVKREMMQQQEVE
jgi:Rod binding domain-containing protein